MAYCILNYLFSQKNSSTFDNLISLKMFSIQIFLLSRRVSFCSKRALGSLSEAISASINYTDRVLVVDPT